MELLTSKILIWYFNNFKLWLLRRTDWLHGNFIFEKTWWYDASTQDHVYTNNVSGEEGGNDDCVYSNNDDITKYRIPVTELQNVINEKHKDDGFLCVHH
jgi:regulatory protein YycH of two-component signal transduction system YycFG